MLKTISDGIMYFTSVPGGKPDDGEPEAKGTDIIVEEMEMDNDEWNLNEDRAISFIPKKFKDVWED